MIDGYKKTVCHPLGPGSYVAYNCKKNEYLSNTCPDGTWKTSCQHKKVINSDKERFECLRKNPSYTWEDFKISEP